MGLGLAQPCHQLSCSTRSTLMLCFPFVLRRLAWKNTKFQAPRETWTWGYSGISDLCNFWVCAEAAFMLGELWNKKVRPWKSSDALEDDSLVTAGQSQSLRFWPEDWSEIWHWSHLEITGFWTESSCFSVSTQAFACPCALVGGGPSRCHRGCWWPYCVAWHRVPVKVAHCTPCFCFLALGNLAPVLRADSRWLYQGPVLPVRYSQELDTFWWESMSCSGDH